MMNWVASLNRKTLAIGSLIAAAILLLAVNLFVGETFRGARVDLTENKLYTITEGTRDMLAKVDEPIEVRLYFSDIIGEIAPGYKRYFERVRGLLNRYSELSSGKIKVSAINPEPFSDAEDRAVGAGLSAIPLGDTGEKGYFGLVATNTTDNEEVIPLLNPEEQPFLEYTLSSLIYKLSDPKKKVIGYVAGVPMEGSFSAQGQVPPWLILQQLRDFYDMRKLSVAETAKIDDTIDMLVLFQPAGLSDAEIYAIDQFALAGKPVIILADPNVEVAPQQAARFGKDDKLLQMLQKWGVELPYDKVVGDLDNARRIQFPGPSGQPVIVNYVLWQIFNAENFDAADPVFNGVSRLAFATAGALSQTEGAKTSFTPLVFSSANSEVLPASDALQPDPPRLLNNFKPSGNAVPFAARVSGEAESVFGDKAPELKDIKLEGHKAAGAVQAIVVSDVDWMFDRLWLQVNRVLGQEIIQPIANNGDLLLNMTENMLGGNLLVGVRGRGVDNRPFTYVDDLQRKAEAKFRDQEQVLNAKLEDVTNKIAQIQAREQDAAAQGAEIMLTEDDQKALLGFRNEMVAVRKDLREVQRALREDIDRTEMWLKVLNIALVPALIALGGIIVLGVRRRRRHQPARHGGAA